MIKKFLDKWITETYIRRQIHKLIPIPIKIKCGDRFIYWNDGVNEVINYSVESFDKKSEKEFDNYIEKTYGVDMSKYSFIFSLLHEVGHYMTIEQVDVENENLLRQLIQDNNAYFNLESEKLANDWAYWYFTSCFDECKHFTKKVLPLIKHFYKNGQNRSNRFILVKGR